MTPAEIVRILATVPETTLRLVELSWELATPEGHLDMEKAVAMAHEIDVAREQAAAYVEATRRVALRLRNFRRCRQT